jgi:hypothetical protein
MILPLEQRRNAASYELLQPYIQDLAEAVRGCGTAFDLDPRAESDVCDYRNRHCVSCKRKMWDTIGKLTGVSNLTYL